mmetsp:Transcript_10485/g.18002  ORF Transcript_10485/g.18002 Transcript_10485/m.18002 type:complete len:91 (+) Transcript_10485:833-1105(+)
MLWKRKQQDAQPPSGAGWVANFSYFSDQLGIYKFFSMALKGTLGGFPSGAESSHHTGKENCQQLNTNMGALFEIEFLHFLAAALWKLLLH